MPDVNSVFLSRHLTPQQCAEVINTANPNQADCDSVTFSLFMIKLKRNPMKPMDSVLETRNFIKKLPKTPIARKNLEYSFNNLQSIILNNENGKYHLSSLEKSDKVESPSSEE